ncbi:unnamed protein product [Symbiodinium sp. CCMP2592]|nr:unnamed protein product [Symbiodinium sp. CCMP2592]
MDDWGGEALALRARAKQKACVDAFVLPAELLVLSHCLASDEDPPSPSPSPTPASHASSQCSYTPAHQSLSADSPVAAVVASLAPSRPSLPRLNPRSRTRSRSRASQAGASQAPQAGASQTGEDCRDHDFDPPDDNACDTDDSVEIIDKPTVWSDLWNLSQEESLLVYPLRLPMEGPLPSEPDSRAHAAERLAFDICRRGSCSTADFCTLATLLPEQAQPRRRQTTTSDGATGRLQRAFLTGAYSIGGGGIRGIQANTGLYPWLTTWLTSVVRGAKEDHQFSSCAFLVNTLHYMHRDTGNAPGTSNLLIPCNRWQGGQLWLADASGSVRLDATGPPGVLLNVTRPYIQLNPDTLHATYPWGAGDRLLLVAYHARAVDKLPAEGHAQLRRRGFRFIPCAPTGLS